MATLKDVAELAGVSTATVSLALNDGPVNAETRIRVIEAARQINYVPNAIGRSLITGRTRTIQLLTLTSDLHTDTVRKTSLFYYILEGVLSVASERNYSVRFDVKSHEDPGLTNYIERLVGGGAVDGIAIIPQFHRSNDFMEAIFRDGFPYMLLQPECFGPDKHFVDMGNYAGAFMVAELFATAGARWLAFINGPKMHVDSIERERGFSDCIAIANPDSLRVWHGDFTIQGGYTGMSELLRQGRPDSVFCGNDYMAAGAIRRLLEAGIRVPGDVSVVGYDDNDICTGVFPPLTSVNNRFFELGNALAEGLLAQIADPMVAWRQTFTPFLVERQSHRQALRVGTGHGTSQFSDL